MRTAKSNGNQRNVMRLLRVLPIARLTVLAEASGVNARARRAGQREPFNVNAPLDVWIGGTQNGAHAPPPYGAIVLEPAST